MAYAIGQRSPVLSGIFFDGDVYFKENATGDIPVQASATTLKFLNNVVTAAQVTTGSHAGPTFSVNVTGKQNREYDLVVAVKAVDGLGNYWTVNTYKISHFDIATPLASIGASHNVYPGAGSPIGVTLTLTAGTDTVAVNFTNATAATYKITTNFLDQIDI